MYTVGVSLALGTFQDAKINCSSATLLMGVQKITKASEEGPVGSGPLSHDVVRMLHVRCGGSNSLGSTYLGAVKKSVMYLCYSTNTHDNDGRLVTTLACERETGLEHPKSFVMD